MRNNIVDVNVYVVSKNSEGIVPTLVEKMNVLTGVVNVNINQNVKRMLNIQYDAKQVSSSDIVRFINKNECRGALVGF